VTGSLVVDVLLVFVFLGYAAAGVRRGFIHGALALLGFAAGGVLGVVLLPPLVERFGNSEDSWLRPGLGRVVVVLLGLLALAWLGQLLGSLAGRRLRDNVRSRPGRVVDGALGAVTALAAVALLTFFVAGALRGSPSPALSRAVAESKVVAVVDRFVPPQVGSISRGFRALLDAGGFPRVFEGLGPEVILPVDPPAAADVDGVAGAVAGSIVKITGVADSCDRGLEGTGFVVAPQRVVTNAHVVAGVDEPRVQVGGEGRALAGEVVLLDPDRDLAVLAVPGLQAAALPLGQDLGRGDPALIAGFPLDGPYTAEAARVRQVLTASGENIYGQPGAERQVYSLFATVEPGNSGGPLLDASGAVVGVIFAKSLDDPQTGYALTLAESMPVLHQAAQLSEPVDVGACARG
jgi:S1-C subfamily serine protease